MMTSLLALLASEGLLALDLAALARGPGGGDRSERRSGAVAVVPMIGPLASRSRETWFGSIPGMDRLRGSIEAAGRNPDISAVVLDIDSPGGTVAGTAETAAAVRAVAAVKPVVAVANGLAASAAYWIASGASEFVVTPSAEVGSIGILMQHQNLAKLYDRMGVENTFITSVPYKAELSPHGPLSDEARDHLKARVMASHAQFVGDVATGRKRSASHVEEHFGKGRMVDAADAVRAGMADRIASLETVISGLLNGEAPRASASPRRRADVFALM